ncbi:Futalosine hydrolase [Rubripirellula lacrimiformis]|uniref:Futalosine hydrolase n=2 Tax=Rubripirellula lacrimiformis TaxID=1930273 RepID=A0A517NG18_9BACT|nr:Futalosine hydrolase [Rubripirellula lacrimiformis]
MEMSSLRDPIELALQQRLATIQPPIFQLCGFGPVAAAARAAALIADHRPDRVLLVGIAGSLDLGRCPVGTSWQFDEVMCDGIGVGAGPGFVSASKLGWPQFGGEPSLPTIGDALALDCGGQGSESSAGRLLTVPNGSACDQDAKNRRSRFPGAAAEDMEGFAVAMACTLAAVPLRIVRGISNLAGDRNHANWKIDDALAAAATMVVDLILPDPTNLSN